MIKTNDSPLSETGQEAGQEAGQFYRRGILGIVPFLPGVAAFGVAYGALAVSNGLTFLQTLGMSVLVLAGSSQFMAVELIGNQVPLPIIVLATFLVNFRHVLYSTTLSRMFELDLHRWKWLLAYIMVDESYAVLMAESHRRKLTGKNAVWFFMGAGTGLVSTWWATTIVGAISGQWIPDNLAEISGLTLPLLLTGLVVSMLSSKPTVVAAVTAAMTGVVFGFLPYRSGLLLATAVGVAAAMMMERYQEQPVMAGQPLLNEAVGND